MCTFTPKTIIITGLCLLNFSTLNATEPSLATKRFQPANPDMYPYPMYKDEIRNGKKVRTLYDGAIIKNKTFQVQHVYHAPYNGKGMNRGTPATQEQITAWNTDVRPDGEGLPKGSMSVAEGAEIYMEKCGSCHGDFGEGVDKFPVLSGGFGTLTLQPNHGAEPGPEKTLGSYANYIAPFFWYIQTAMPLAAPKSLSNSETYGILGYLLQVNEIQVNGKDIDDETIIDSAFIKSVHLPNEDGFVYNNLRNPLTNNTRCMENCIDEKRIQLLRIQTDGTEVEPPFGEERWFFGESQIKTQNSLSHTRESYESHCAGCHAQGIIGAPKVGDKKAWNHVLKKGLDRVMENSITGIGGMPPKGGATDLSDLEIKEIINFMINSTEE
jgi:S-disulfanyl-L-cysteine oxidoreductase SoxD